MRIGGGNSSQSQGPGASSAHTAADPALSNSEPGRYGPGLRDPNRSRANLNPHQNPDLAVTNVTTTSGTTTTFTATNTGPGRAGGNLAGRVAAAPDVIVWRNSPEARSRQSKLAEAKANALFRTGRRHAEGDKGAPDRVRAMEFYTKAANLGHAEAQYQLGLHCLDGPARDPVQEEDAFAWFVRAGAQDHVQAQVMVGSCFATGRGGVDIDARQARKWWRQAARQGNLEAQLALVRSYQICTDIPDHLAKAARWLGKAARGVDARAMTLYGQMLARGEGIARDDHAALSWFQRAADKDNAGGLFWLGVFHQVGRGGLPVNARRAYEFYTQAARKKHAQAQFARAYMLWHGIGTYANLPKSVRAYMKAAMQGVAEAQWRLGICLEHGLCVSKDIRAAIDAFNMAAASQDPDAQFHLARCHYRGIGVEKNRSTAVEWLAVSKTYAHLILRDSHGNIDSAQALRLLDHEVEAYEERLIDMLEGGAMVYREMTDDAGRNESQEGQDRLDPAEPQDSSDSPDSPDSADSQDYNDSQETADRESLLGIQERSEPSSPHSSESSVAEGRAGQSNDEPLDEGEDSPKCYG